MFKFLLLFLSLALPIFTLNETNVVAFMNSHLSKFTKNVEVKWVKDKGPILITKRPFKKGEVIFSVPKELVLSNYDNYPRSYFFYEMYRQDSVDMLMGRLLLEKFVLKQGFLHNYFVTFTSQEALNDVIYQWNEEDVQEMNRRQAYLEEPPFEGDAYFKPIEQLIEINKPFLDKYQPKFPEEMFKPESLKWAYSVLSKYGLKWSKSLHCKLNGFDPTTFKRIIEQVEPSEDLKFKEEGMVLIPFINLIAHRKTTNYPSEYPLNNYPESKETLEFLGYNTSERLNMTKSFTENPLYDLLHLRKKVGNDLFSNLVVKNGSVSLKANKDYQKSEELKYELGNYQNSIWVPTYGLIEENNEFESFFYRAPWSKFSEQERNLSVKLGIATQEDLKNGYTTFLFRPKQINHAFLYYLKLFLMNTQQVSFTPDFNETKVVEVFRRGFFKNKYLEALLWMNYYLTIDYRNGFRTPIKQDRTDLLAEKNERRRKMIKVGISQKENVYKHLFASWGKFIKTVHYSINLQFLKDSILKIVSDPSNYKEAMFFYPERD